MKANKKNKTYLFNLFIVLVFVLLCFLLLSNFPIQTISKYSFRRVMQCEQTYQNDGHNLFKQLAQKQNRFNYDHNHNSFNTQTNTLNKSNQEINFKEGCKKWKQHFYLVQSTNSTQSQLKEQPGREASQEWKKSALYREKNQYDGSLYLRKYKLDFDRQRYQQLQTISSYKLQQQHHQSVFHLQNRDSAGKQQNLESKDRQLGGSAAKSQHKSASDVGFQLGNAYAAYQQQKRLQRFMIVINKIIQMNSQVLYNY